MNTTTPQTARTVTVEEAGAMLGVSRWLAYEEVRRSGQLAGIPVLKIGRRLLVPREALERVLSGECAPTTDRK